MEVYELKIGVQRLKKWGCAKIKDGVRRNKIGVCRD